MITTLQALGVVLFAVLPGALYTLTFERRIGWSGAATTDRLLSFVAASAVLHVAAAPLTWWLSVHYVLSGRLEREPVPWELWPVLVGYLALPVLAGAAVGAAARRSGPGSGFPLAPARGPRAWEEVFTAAARHSAWLRIRLKDPSAGVNGWLAGAYARASRGPHSFASGYPDPQDLYLTVTAECDANGQLVRTPEGSVVVRSSGLLVRWDEILYLEIEWA